MTTDQSKLLVATLVAAYPRQDIQPETVSLYSRTLGDLDFDIAQEAVRRHIASSRFFPTVAEIRELAAEMTCRLPSPTAAYELMLAAVLDRRSADLPDEVRRALNRVGGGYEVRTNTNTTALRAQFLRAYEEIRRERILGVVVGDEPAALPAGVEPRQLAAGSNGAA